MKISIWQQFSSNHSNSFIVVGKFATAEAAQKALEQLRADLIPLQDYNWDYRDLDNPLLLEIEIGKRYGIEWKIHHDWVTGSNGLDDTKTFDNYLLVASGQTDAGYKPFDELVAKLGGIVSAESELGDTEVIVTITFQAPDDETAQKIYQVMNDTGWEGWIFANPWLGYADGQKQPDADEVIRVDQIRAARSRKFYQLHLQYLDLVPRTELREIIDKELAQLPSLTREQEMFLLDVDVRVGIVEAVRSVSLNSNMITFEAKFWSNIFNTLPAIIGWLKDQGCTDIQYDIRQDVKKRDEET